MSAFEAYLDDSGLVLGFGSKLEDFGTEFVRERAETGHHCGSKFMQEYMKFGIQMVGSRREKGTSFSTLRVVASSGPRA